MTLNTEKISAEIPLIWYVEREGATDIYYSRNTGNIDVDINKLKIPYVVRAANYRDQQGKQRDKERYIFVSDDINSARKTAFLFAGDIKNIFYLAEDAVEMGMISEDEADLDSRYATKSEAYGVIMADVDLHTYPSQGRAFPESNYELDGAFFYGVQAEDELLRNLNLILTCELPFVAVAVSEEMWNTKSVRKLIFDYWFDEYDARKLAIQKNEAIALFKMLADDNEDYEIPGDDESVAGYVDALMKLRGEEFREEDLIKLVELIVSEEKQLEFDACSEEKPLFLNLPDRTS